MGLSPFFDTVLLESLNSSPPSPPVTCRAGNHNRKCASEQVWTMPFPAAKGATECGSVSAEPYFGGVHLSALGVAMALQGLDDFRADFAVTQADP